MVNVRITDKNGKTWIARFPKKATLQDVRTAGKRINPNIRKVEYYRRKRASRPRQRGFGMMRGLNIPRIRF